LLDLYGFEVFQVNGFEQFLINYCNERMQQYFNRQVFACEAEEYEAEGFDTDGHWRRLLGAYQLPALALLEGEANKSTGIFGVINDRSRCGFEHSKDKSEGLVDSIVASYGKHPAFCKASRNPGRVFGVRHFAGEVFYEAAQFVGKNASAHRPDIVEFLRASVSTFVQELLGSDADGSPQSGDGASEDALGRTASSAASSSSRPRKLFGKTLISTFQQEMNELSATLEARECHHVRCLRPNDEQAPLEFDDTSMLRQCRYSGLLEATRIRRQGYAHRRPLRTFAARYALLLHSHESRRLARHVLMSKAFAACSTICEAAVSGGLPPDSFRIGHTKVFLREPGLVWFETARSRLAASVVVAALKCNVAKQQFLRQRRVAIRVQAAYRGACARGVARKLRAERPRPLPPTATQVSETEERQARLSCQDAAIRAELAATKLQRFWRRQMATVHLQQTSQLSQVLSPIHAIKSSPLHARSRRQSMMVEAPSRRQSLEAPSSRQSAATREAEPEVLSMEVFSSHSEVSVATIESQTKSGGKDLRESTGQLQKENKNANRGSMPRRFQTTPMPTLLGRSPVVRSQTTVSTPQTSHRQVDLKGFTPKQRLSTPVQRVLREVSSPVMVGRDILSSSAGKRAPSARVYSNLNSPIFVEKSRDAHRSRAAMVVQRSQSAQGGRFRQSLSPVVATRSPVEAHRPFLRVDCAAASLRAASPPPVVLSPVNAGRSVVRSTRSTQTSSPLMLQRSAPSHAHGLTLAPSATGVATPTWSRQPPPLAIVAATPMPGNVPAAIATVAAPPPMVLTVQTPRRSMLTLEGFGSTGSIAPMLSRCWSSENVMSSSWVPPPVVVASPAHGCMTSYTPLAHRTHSYVPVAMPERMHSYTPTAVVCGVASEALGPVVCTTAAPEATATAVPMHMTMLLTRGRRSYVPPVVVAYAAPAAEKPTFIQVSPTAGSSGRLRKSVAI